MKTDDLRRANWADVQGHLTENRRAVYELMQRFGAGTCKEIASAFGWDVTSIRPRVTELVDMFYAEVVLDAEGYRVRRNGEYVFRARSGAEAERAHRAARQGELFPV